MLLFSERIKRSGSYFSPDIMKLPVYFSSVKILWEEMAVQLQLLKDALRLLYMPSKFKV